MLRICRCIAQVWPSDASSTRFLKRAPVASGAHRESAVFRSEVGTAGLLCSLANAICGAACGKLHSWAAESALATRGFARLVAFSWLMSARITHRCLRGLQRSLCAYIICRKKETYLNSSPNVSIFHTWPFYGTHRALLDEKRCTAGPRLAWHGAAHDLAMA